MIIDLPLLPDRIDTQSAGRPIRMGFFHFSNNNLSIRRQCAREIGMYDLNASKSEDVDLCFRVALDPNWVAWRANEAIVRHKGRRTLWGLVAQMWGWGFYLGYPYSKTGIRGMFLYWLDARKHSLVGRFESGRFPILICAFPTDFYFLNTLLFLMIWALCFGHTMLALTAVAGLSWTVPRYLSDVRHVRLRRWDKIKLALVQYATNVAFTTAAFVGGLKHRVILIPCSVFKPDPPKAP